METYSISTALGTLVISSFSMHHLIIHDSFTFTPQPFLFIHFNIDNETEEERNNASLLTSISDIYEKALDYLPS